MQQAALDLKAPLASPAFTGTPTKGGSPVLSQADASDAYASVPNPGTGATAALIDTAKQGTAPSLAAVAAIPNCKWLFSPDTGFFSDQAGTTRQTTDGGGVKCWKDGSPNADHATTASAGLTLAQGAGPGIDALNIAGSTTRLKTTGTFDSSFDAGFTFFAVVSNPTASSNLVYASSNDSRWYAAWNGAANTFGCVMSATTLPNAVVIPPDIPTAANTQANAASVMVEALRYNGPSVAPDMFYDGYVNPCTTSVASATAAALTGTFNIGGLGASFSWGGKILALVMFNRVLTNAEVQVVHNYLSSVCEARPKPLVQCVGNSITAGTNASRNTPNVPGSNQQGYAKSGNTDWPSQLLDLCPAGDVMVRMDAYPGRTLTQINAELPRTTMAQFDPATHGKRIAIVWEITNALGTNLAANIASLNAGTLPAAYTDLVTACQTLQAQGWVVGVVTCMPRSDLSAANIPLFYRGYQAINRLIRTNWPTFANFLVDMAADPRLGLPGSELNTTYFSSDKAHLTDEGYRIAAGKVKAALDKILPISSAKPVLTKSVAGAANVTLTQLEAGTVTLPGGNGIVVLTGALTGNINVVLPLTAGAQALFHNNTSGAFTVTLIGASGTGYAITQGKKARAYTDGTNWLQATPEV